MTLLEPINQIDPNQKYKSMETRHAVKAFCLKDGKYVVLALNDGTYKLPGGGVNGTENEIEALSRELSEECGIDGLSRCMLAFHINEYKTDKFDESCIFHISTNVYVCKVDKMSDAQVLDEYEQALGMQPVQYEKEQLEALFEAGQNEWSERDRKIVQAFCEERK